MNVEQLQKQLNKPVKLRGPAHYRENGGSWREVDWLWRLMRIDGKLRSIELHSHQYCLTLMSDHIKEFMRSSDREFEGFLLLKVAIYVEGNNITVEPAIAAF